MLGLSLVDNVDCANTDKSIMENAFLIDNEGKIFVNGAEKRTVLPKLTRGTKVSIYFETVNLRINNRHLL